MFSICQLTDNNFFEIERIFLKTFPRTDDADFAEAWRTKECNYSLGLFHKATLVGFAITCMASNAIDSNKRADASEVARLWFIAVDPVQRSAGAGTQLLTALIDACVANGLHLVLTPDNNPRIIDWYKRHGFTITKIMPFINDSIPIYWMEYIGNDCSSVSDATTKSAQSSPISRGSFSSDCSMISLEGRET